MGSKWWLWMLVLLNGCCYCCFGCLEEERTGLLQLKASLNPPNDIPPPRIVAREPEDCCQWKGVQCSKTTGHVIALNLFQIRTTIQASGLWNLNASMFLPFEQLRSLDLNNNAIYCCVDNGGFERLWHRLTHLEFLDLSWTNLDGSIIPSLVGFPSLKTLNLSRLYMGSARIQIQELNKMTNLKELVLQQNVFQRFGSIQEGGGRLRLRNLEILDLSYNLLTNNVLSSLGELPSLKILNLRQNRLNGSIEVDFDALNNLEEFDASENNIDRFLAPGGIKTSSKLKVMHLDNMPPSNSSKLLQSLGAFISLKTLYLRNYNLQGLVASGADLNTLNMVEVLFLDGASLDTNFLQSIGTLTSLRVLSLRTCNLNGKLPLPEDLNTLNMVEVLFLDGASLDMNFLQSIGTLTSLRVLSLRTCKLNGTLPLPEGLCKLKNLEELDLSQSQFEGTLPSCLGSLSSLRVLDIKGNQFHGNLASSPLTNLHSLEYLSISDNLFQVPHSFKSFANHSNLTVFFGDSNELVEETESIQALAPRFQLKVFSLSNCTSKSKGLNPKLPNFLFHQHDLRILDLSFNNFGGSFPAWLLQNNTRLKAIYLRDNRYTGSLQFPSHPNPDITMVDFSNMNMPGRLPENISSVFPNLQRLNMSGNELRGEIPKSVGNLKSLEVLDLSNNNLSGGFPGSLAKGCFSLWFLKLSHNNLEGEISPESLNFADMIYLYLAGNNFVGKISGISYLNHLAVLDLSSNHFSGNLPSSMLGMQGLSLSNNHFDGPIPPEFCQFETLEFLDLSENNLSGSIPSCFSPRDLIHAYLNKNNLSGPLTRAFCYSASLVTLELSDNNFTGTIPSCISNPPDLSVVLLRDNWFSGVIPIQLCQLSRLSLLDLSGNDLFGPIPPCFSNITFQATNLKTHLYNLVDSMYNIKSEATSAYLRETELEKQDNFFDFSEATQAYFFVCIDLVEKVEFRTKRRLDSYERKNLNMMSGIDLSRNKLSGEIPSDLGNLRMIYALNLSRNNLTGSIPTAFSKLSWIESLDLSYNHLQGHIPSELTELNSLAVFSVAHNDLSGPVPARVAQFGTFEESSYEGNPFLCGPPLQSSCTQTPVKPNISEKEEEGGWIDIDVFYLSFVVTYTAMLFAVAAILYINPCWRRVWFHFMEECFYTCYHFASDSFSKLFKF